MADYVTPGQAAAALGVTRDTIRRYVDAGKLDAIKTPGGQRRINADSLRAATDPTHDKAPGH